MICTETEYKNIQETLQQIRQILQRQQERLEETGLSEAEVERALGPLISFRDQRRDEVEACERPRFDTLWSDFFHSSALARFGRSPPVSPLGGCFSIRSIRPWSFTGDRFTILHALLRRGLRLPLRASTEGTLSARENQHTSPREKRFSKLIVRNAFDPSQARPVAVVS
jgi:hypothetical protein